jgi:hypothetical protein
MPKAVTRVTMKYVEIDEQGTVSWDRYFEYLRGVRAQFPPEVYSYAIKWEHYALDSVSSLHDAWLTSARFASPSWRSCSRSRPRLLLDL